MNKLLDIVQRRFGKITREKLIVAGIVSFGFVCIFAFIWWAQASVSDAVRPWLITGFAVAMASTAYVYFRHERRKRIKARWRPKELPAEKHLKIPVKQSEHETYVTLERPITAPIPLVANQTSPHNVTPPEQARFSNKALKVEVELSAFAKRRIAQRLPDLNGRKAIFEARKSIIELLIQLEKRRPTGKMVKKFGSKDKLRAVLEPPTTIYGELFFVLLSLFIVSLPIIHGLFTPPQWIVALINPLSSSQLVPLVLFGVGGILLIWSTWLFYRKLAYWYFWRLILFDADPDHDAQARLAIIDMPLLMPGGTTPSMYMEFVRLAKSATFRSKSDQVSNQLEKRSFRSILAGLLGVSWLIVDTYSSKDEDFGWMGPFRNTQQLETYINKLIAESRSKSV